VYPIEMESPIIKILGLVCMKLVNRTNAIVIINVSFFNNLILQLFIDTAFVFSRLMSADNCGLVQLYNSQKINEFLVMKLEFLSQPCLAPRRTRRDKHAYEFQVMK
jgi:hypothetical protein